MEYTLWAKYAVILRKVFNFAIRELRTKAKKGNVLLRLIESNKERQKLNLKPERPAYRSE